MTLNKRLTRLELTRPKPRADVLVLDLPPDLCARVDAAEMAGTFPESLSFDDLLAVSFAAEKAREQK